MTTGTGTASDKCWTCQPFGSGPACGECARLSTVKREARLTDTLVAEILAEERASNQQANPASKGYKHRRIRR